MEGDLFPVSTLHGTVYLTVVPKQDHRAHIFQKLSRFLDRQVTELDLKIREGSTRPEFPDLSIDANWTHSKSTCVLAFSRECRVGVDLEFHSKNRLSLAERFYSAEEVAHLRQVERQQGADKAIEWFYTLWCRKEAFYKCLGGEFFEGALRRSLLDSCVDNVSMIDLNPTKLGISEKCSLCIATKLLG